MRSAFTLLELLIVVILLALLASIVIPMFHDFTDRAVVSARQTDINCIMEALEVYRLNIGDYPGNLDELQVAVTAPGPNGQLTDYGPWLRDLGVDPIDLQPYDYARFSDTSYTLEGELFNH